MVVIVMMMTMVLKCSMVIVHPCCRHIPSTCSWRLVVLLLLLVVIVMVTTMILMFSINVFHPPCRHIPSKTQLEAGCCGGCGGGETDV